MRREVGRARQGEDDAHDIWSCVRLGPPDVGGSEHRECEQANRGEC